MDEHSIRVRVTPEPIVVYGSAEGRLVKDPDGEAKPTTWDDLIGRLDSAGPGDWVNVSFCRDFPKIEALKLGGSFVEEVVNLFVALRPIYEELTGESKMGEEQEPEDDEAGRRAAALKAAETRREKEVEMPLEERAGYKASRTREQRQHFWEMVEGLVGRELRTLHEHNPFTVDEVRERRVGITVGTTGNPRTIRREEIELAWERLVKEGTISRVDIHRQFSSFNPAFVAAILAALPGVTHRTEPIRLFYGREGEPEAAPETPPGEETPAYAPPERRRDGQLVATELIPLGPLFTEAPEEPEAARVESVEPPTAEEIPVSEPATEEPIPSPPEEPPTPPPTPPPPPEPVPLAPTYPRPQRPRPSSKSLFSQHYLAHRIQEHPEWAEDVSEPFAQLAALYESKRHIQLTPNEAQTEAEFIRPALELLGFAYIPQTPIHRAGRVQRPDYALFADEAAKSEAYTHQQDEAAFYARALAIADAKYWDRPLSEMRRDDPGDIFKNTNPSFQMVNYLTGTGVDWGILTNGRVWRLYYRQASSTATEFYEVDLMELLESGDLERFKYFWLFFRRAAFVRDAQGRNFLERVREGSATYAQVIGDRLKELVFAEVFTFLAGGFIAYDAARGGDLTAETTRHAVYEATLSLLYKALFLLYAEARDLLPVGNPGYRAQSLTRMAQEVAEKIDRAEPLGRTSTALYDRLLNLFCLIDRGDPGLGLPRYNGGLFHFDFGDPADRDKQSANWFLTQHKVPDEFLAPAIDRLYRAGGEPVDYGYIGVRHLGAIYEGLLEYRLAVDEAASGQVHLETDKGERKATGSYYTPDYIVKYIVSHTLGPILEERARRFDELMAQIAEVRRQLADARQIDNVPVLREKLERLERQARETLLDIKCCDPAMGSGHFLVEAVDFLTDGLVDILNRYPEHNPVLAMLEHIRREIVASLERQGIPVDLLARLDDTQLLQRVVMKRCIYGVDLNPMAVELAKVSLWLHSFTIGAPLSFLDHHLRCGNSLIGAMAGEAHRQLSSELPLFGGPFAGLLRAAEIMRGISLLSDATFAEVEESERLFRQFDQAATPYKRLLDVFVARHFGVQRADEFLRLYGADALQASPDSLGEPYATAVREARRLYEEKRFFHWDLERATWKENPGFDAVVGNPPYVNANELNKILSKFEKPFWKTKFQSAVGAYDLYILFLELAIKLTRQGYFASMITPNKFLSAPYAQAFREYVSQTVKLLRLLDLSHVRTFEDPSIYPIVSIFQSIEPEQEYQIMVEAPTDSENLAEIKVIEQHSGNLEKLPEMIWGFLISEHLPLVLKAESTSIQLQSCSTVRASSTASEADAFADALVNTPTGHYKRFINTGLIDRHDVLWGIQPLTHKKKSFETPYLMLSHSSVSDERKKQYGKPKIVFAKMA
jgi:hypothetical protein